MRILWVSHFVPYPDTGYGALQRSRNFIKCISRNHEIILVCLCRTSDRKMIPDMESAVNDLRKYCKEVHLVHHESGIVRQLQFAIKSLLFGTPYTVSMYRSTSLQDEVMRIIKIHKVDIVHADTIGLIEPLIGSFSCGAILNHHNLESEMMKRRFEKEKSTAKRIFLENEYRCLRRYEIEHVPKFDANILVSDLDATGIRDLVGNVRSQVVENGVDCDYFTFHPRQPASSGLIFAGALDWYPNAYGIRRFLREYYPLIRKERPDIHMTIIGRNPPEKLKRTVDSMTGVSLLGYVNDVRPFVQNSRIFVCPLFDGGGTRLKILDALAQGIPVVSTGIGCEGLGLKDGENILIGDTVADFRRQTMRLLEDTDYCNYLSMNGRRFVEENYSYSVLVRKMERIYFSVIPEVQEAQ